MNFWKSSLRIVVFLAGLLGLTLSSFIIAHDGLNFMDSIPLLSSLAACIYPFFPEKKPSPEEQTTDSLKIAKGASIGLALPIICFLGIVMLLTIMWTLAEKFR